MEPSRDDLLFATLESLRPAPSPAFAAKLDERAAAGFPPRSRSAASPHARIAAWFRGLSPRRMLLAGGATALAAVAIATVVVAGSGSGSGSELTKTGGGSMLSQLNRFSDDAETASPETSESSAGGSSGTMHEAEAPTVTGKSVAPDASSSSSAAKAKPTGPYASGANHRDVERAAEMVLGTEPSEVGDAAGKILEAVHQYDGIVLSSSVRGGSEGDAGARFDLLIPSAKLSDALAAFSGIAEVRSRHEASNDITAPTNTVGEGLQDSHAKIDALLNELAGSETETQREAIEAQLRSERRHAAALKSQLSNLQRRANLSRVTLQIETGASSAPSSGGGWDLGDAFHDAGHILTVAAGVAIVGLAILAPIALIALLFWLGNRAWVHQRRERALG
jgi:Domain of unknown function (DUF4349)